MSDVRRTSVLQGEVPLRLLASALAGTEDDRRDVRWAFDWADGVPGLGRSGPVCDGCGHVTIERTEHKGEAHCMNCGNAMHAGRAP